jgi:uncharacterized protein (TIGR02145 family)
MKTARWVLILTIVATGAVTPVSIAGDSVKAHAESGTFTDPRDGQTYAWVRIGKQIWMAENLRFATERGSWCWENYPAECEKRGRFYNWEAACLAAPPGWHLPTDNEWKTLEMALGLTAEQADDTGVDRGGESNTAGAALKKTGAWATEHNGNAIVYDNATGFSAIPTGIYARDTFFHEGYAGWWTSSVSGNKAWCHSLRFFDNKVGRDENNRAFAFSVRCVKDDDSE